MHFSSGQRRHQKGKGKPGFTEHGDLRPGWLHGQAGLQAQAALRAGQPHPASQGESHPIHVSLALIELSNFSFIICISACLTQ